MESLHNSKHYNGVNDYEISIIQENDGSIVTTIYEVQENRSVAVYRKQNEKDEKSTDKLAEEARAVTEIFKYLI